MKNQTSDLLCVLEGAEVRQDPDSRVHFVGDLDIDADGANGQNGFIPAYRIDNRGSELLANAGYPKSPKAYRNILQCDSFGNVVVQPNGVIFSKTAYEHSGNPPLTRWLDAETVPYMVVSPLIRKKARGIVLGCLSRITYLDNGESIFTVVGDIGPTFKMGEASIAAARGVKINADPRKGGVSARRVLYEIWPGRVAEINGGRYVLKPA